jgi:hypothetical protein
METDRIIRILQRYQKPEGDREKIPLYDLCLYGSGLQKAIEVIRKLQTAEMQQIVQQYEQADEPGKRRLSRINAALMVCKENY